MKKEVRFLRQMRAREVWSAILELQIEKPGAPYMLYKDAANTKSKEKMLLGDNPVQQSVHQNHSVHG